MESRGVLGEPTHVGGQALAEVQAELWAKGYRWHFFGIPHNRQGEAWDGGPDRYWFNGSTLGEGRGRLTKQPFGWFTLEEMRAEKFAEGLHAEPFDAARGDLP